MAKKRGAGKKANEDQDVLNKLKEQAKEAQRNVMMARSAERKGPGPAMRYWDDEEIQSLNRFRKENQRKQASAQRLISAQKDIMRGRTVEFGTRSLLEGMKSWMRGGGGFRIGGR
jgi:hypothetical protein